MLTSLVANSLALASLLIMLSSGLALIYGLRDVINFGHGALYMLGAYVGYSIANLVGFWAALILTPILLALVGLVFEYAVLRPLQRRSHIEVALVTLGLGVLVGQALIYVYGGEARSVDAPLTLAAGEMVSHGVMLEVLRDYTSGADGLVVGFKGTLFGLRDSDYANATCLWPIAWTAVWLFGACAWSLRPRRLGAVLRAIRVNEERMRFSGFNTYLPRLAGYVFVNLIAAVCGLLHVLNSGFVSPEGMSLSVSTNALVAALIGGTAGSAGPIVGGLLYVFAQDEFGARGFTQVLTGAAIVVFIVALPRGLVGGLAETLGRRLGAATGTRR